VTFACSRCSVFCFENDKIRFPKNILAECGFLSRKFGQPALLAAHLFSHAGKFLNCRANTHFALFS
jgi:hypothetical protein